MIMLTPPQNKLAKLNNFRLDLDNARRQHNRSDLERVRHQQKSDNVPDHVLSKIQEQSTDLQGHSPSTLVLPVR